MNLNQEQCPIPVSFNDHCKLDNTTHDQMWGPVPFQHDPTPEDKEACADALGAANHRAMLAHMHWRAARSLHVS